MRWILSGKANRLITATYLTTLKKYPRKNTPEKIPQKKYPGQARVYLLNIVTRLLAVADQTQQHDKHIDEIKIQGQRPENGFLLRHITAV